MISAGRTVHQLSYRLLCRMLRGVLREWMASGEVGSVACRATASLYVLLLEHPVDRRGRCSSCRWPGAVGGHRRCPCRIHRVAQYWLHQPRRTLLLSLDRELGLPIQPPPHPVPDRPHLVITGRSEPEDTDVLLRNEAAGISRNPPRPPRRQPFPSSR